jgi:hypothetical protein
LVTLALIAVPARAQLYSAGPGIRLGDALVLHLGIGLEFDFDSNPFFQNSGQTGVFELRLIPAFDLTNRPRNARRQVEFDFNGQLNYLEYLTSDSAVSKLRQFGVLTGLQVAFLPTHPYNFVIFDNYARTTQAPYSNPGYNLDRDTNELGTRVNLSPGGGRLTFNVGYLFGVDFWEPQPLQDFNLMYHRFDLRGSWRFFPKTAVYIAATEILNLYTHPMSAPKYNHSDSYPLRVEAGLQGLITTKLTMNIWIGYGNGFYQPPPGGTITTVNPNTVVGGFALTWKPTILSTGTLGYAHDFQNSTLGEYYDLDSAYLSWTQLIWRFTGFLRFAYANQRYQGICKNAMGMVTQCTGTNPTAETVSNRADNIFTLSVRVDYPFKDWLVGSIGNDANFNVSNGQLLLGVAGTVPVNYIRDAVYIRLTASY